MSDILQDYREWAAGRETQIKTHSPECHLWPRHERCMIHRLAREAERLRDEIRQTLRAEIARLRLTKDEREVLRLVSDQCKKRHWSDWSMVIDGLLARLGGTP